MVSVSVLNVVTNFFYLPQAEHAEHAHEHFVEAPRWLFYESIIYVNFDATTIFLILRFDVNKLLIQNRIVPISGICCDLNAEELSHVVAFFYAA